MIRPAKYLQVARTTWKQMISYQTDTWLSALVSGFRVLLSFLLWTAIFSGKETVAGYSFNAIITYSLLASILTRLQHQDAPAWQLAGEVRDGQFSRYLVYPVSVAGYFISTGLGRWLFHGFTNLVALLVWGVVFSQYVIFTPDLASLVWLVVLVPLGAIFMMILNHAIALLSLKFVDVSGFMVGKGMVIELLSGALIPLALLPAPIVEALRFTPFYYVVFYPANLVIGKVTEPPVVAALILLGWIGAVYMIQQAWFVHARKHYEGVGI